MSLRHVLLATWSKIRWVVSLTVATGLLVSSIPVEAAPPQPTRAPNASPAPTTPAGDAARVVAPTPMTAPPAALRHVSTVSSPPQLPFAVARTQAAQPLPPPQGLRAAAARDKRSAELVLRDQSAVATKTHLFGATPRIGLVLDVFDKQSSSAGFRLTDSVAHASLGFELASTVRSRRVEGSRAIADGNQISIAWSSFSDHIAETCHSSRAMGQ